MNVVSKASILEQDQCVPKAQLFELVDKKLFINYVTQRGGRGFNLVFFFCYRFIVF